MPDGTINGYRWTNENYYNFNNEFYPTVYENTEASQIIHLNSSLTCGSTFELTTTGDLLSRALVWYGSYQDLGTLRAGGAGSAGALGMNWNNIVVGWSESDPAPSGPGGVRAFYIDVQDPTMLDLGTRRPRKPSAPRQRPTPGRRLVGRHLRPPPCIPLGERCRLRS